MFEKLRPLREEQVALLARELMAGSDGLIIMDSDEGIYLLVRPLPEKFCEIHAACVKISDGEIVPAPFTRSQWTIAYKWTQEAWAAIVTKWKQLMEDCPHE